MENGLTEIWSFATICRLLECQGISFEAITRSRRKIQEQNPDLRDKEAEQFREIEEENYIVEYSNHIPHID